MIRITIKNHEYPKVSPSNSRDKIPPKLSKHDIFFGGILPQFFHAKNKKTALKAI